MTIEELKKEAERIASYEDGTDAKDVISVARRFAASQVERIKDKQDWEEENFRGDYGQTYELMEQLIKELTEGL